MNKSQSLQEMMNMPNITYSSKSGLKLLRYGQLYNRFDQSAEMHYNDAPEKRGTWASIYPYAPFFHTPDYSDGKRKLDFRDQTDTTKKVYRHIDNSVSLKPITFFWKYDIFSHIDKTGSYLNKGWIHYRTCDELVDVLRVNFTKIQKSVIDLKLQTVKDSNTRYFQHHEFEVFVPHEPITNT